MQALGVLFQDAELSRLDLAAKRLDQVADLTDASIAEAHESKSLSDLAAKQVAPIHALLSFWRALRWLVPGWPTNRLPKIKDETQRAAIAELFSGRYNIADAATRGAVDGETAAVVALNALLAHARALAERETFFHWWTEFPTVWRHGSEAVGGFDAVIGNPPWDVLEMGDGVWFCDRDHEIYASKTTADRDALITRLKRRNPRLWDDFQLAKAASQAALRVVRECGDFPYFSTGRINLYRLFVERCEALGNAQAVFGLLVPSGISSDKSGSRNFRYVAEAKRVLAIYDFENRGNPTGSYFPDIDARTKFSAFIFGGKLRERQTMSAAFYLKSPQELQTIGRKLELVAADLLCINPNTASMPMLMSQRDADLTTQIYRTHPILVRRGDEGVTETFQFRYRQGTHNMSTHSGEFVRIAALDKNHWKRDSGGNWLYGNDARVILFEGKMVQMYDHRASSIKINSENVRRPAQEVPTPAAHKADPTFFADEQFAVGPNTFDYKSLPNTLVAFRDITSPTNIRSGIFLFLPKGAAGHTLPVMLPPAGADSTWLASTVLLVAMLNSFICDYCLRQKLQTQHLTLTVLEQLPVIAPQRFEQTMGSLAEDAAQRVGTSTSSVRTDKSAAPAGKRSARAKDNETIADFIRVEVLALTYTAHDMAPFARDMGYVDAANEVRPPFVWDVEDRAHRMARLDAIFMRLYGLSEDDASYVLSTFPIVKRQDEAAYCCYRTRDLILGYMRQLTFGPLTHDNKAL